MYRCGVLGQGALGAEDLEAAVAPAQAGGAGEGGAEGALGDGAPRATYIAVGRYHSAAWLVLRAFCPAGHENSCVLEIHCDGKYTESLHGRWISNMRLQLKWATFPWIVMTNSRKIEYRKGLCASGELAP
jgi:hypothetical protein